jgi:hypothetical protein
MSEQPSQEEFRKVLTGEHPGPTKMRWRFRRLPSDPRCKLCWADDFTALGDVVNTTARLASAAAAGELLVSVAAVEAAGSVPSDAERRTPEARGREATVDLVVLRPAEGRAPVQV